MINNLSNSSISYTQKGSFPLVSPSNKGGTSPTRSPIGKKLDDIQIALEAENKVDTSEFELRTKVLDERVNWLHNSTQKDIKSCEEQIAKAEAKMNLHTNLVEDLNGTKTKEIREVEEDITLQIEIENQNGREGQQKLFKKVEDKITNFKLEVVKEQKKTDELMTKHYEDIQKKVEALHEAIQTEVSLREDDNFKISSRFDQQIRHMQENLSLGTKIRKESEDSLFRALEDMNRKLSIQVNNEKDTREKSEEQMINLLDEAMNKIENHQKLVQSRNNLLS